MRNFLIIACILLCECNSYIKTTPKKYKYLSVPKSKSVYICDSISLMHLLNTLLEKNINPFSLSSVYNKEFTTIYIDSILYSPDKNGMVIFIITKTENHFPENQKVHKSKFFFDATYLFAKKDTTVNTFKLYNYASINFVNFNSYRQVKNALLEYSFGRRATEKKYDDDEPLYNMDDIRFWKGRQFKNIYTDTSFIKFPLKFDANK